MKQAYSGDKFDLIYNSMVLHHIIDTKKIIKTFYNLLNDDGVLCIVDLDKEDGSFHSNIPKYDGHNGFDQDYITDVFKNVGFVNIKIETFYYGKKQNLDKTVPYSLFCILGEKITQK